LILGSSVESALPAHFADPASFAGYVVANWLMAAASLPELMTLPAGARDSNVTAAQSTGERRWRHSPSRDVCPACRLRAPVGAVGSESMCRIKRSGAAGAQRWIVVGPCAHGRTRKRNGGCCGRR